MSYTYNHVTLIGRLTKDPEHRQITDDRGLTYFTLAVDRPYRKEDGKHETDFVPVAFWGKLANVTLQLLSKGKPVLVWGQLHLQRFEKDKETHYRTEISGEGFQLLDKLPPKA